MLNFYIEWLKDIPTPQTHKNGEKHGRRIVKQIGKLSKFAAVYELSVCTGFIAQGT